MLAASRPYALAAAVLVATGAVAAIPLASGPFQLPIRSIETRLVDTDSVLNIPVNLFDDIGNIPYNEVQGIDAFAESFFFGGPWDLEYSTNLVGVDPGDPGRFEAIVDLLVPFTALSGMGAGEYDWDAGLGQQLVGFAAAEFPVSASCAVGCVSPPFDDYFQVPLSDLTSPSGFTFDSADDPGIIDPDGSANSFPEWGLEGTITGPDGADAMPWDGSTYTLDPSVAFENFFNSLMETPPTDGVLGTGIEIPTLSDSVYAVQAVLASLVVAFDPFTPGSASCPGDCSIVTDLGLNYPNLVQDISNLIPGNPIITAWLDAYNGGTANVPTPTQILENITASEQLWTELGLYNPATGTTGLDLSTGSTELTSLLDLGGASDLSSQLSTDFSTLLADLGTTLPASLLSLF